MTQGALFAIGVEDKKTSVYRWRLHEPQNRIF